MMIYPNYYSLLFLSFLQQVCGHGRLLDPPSRASLWRFFENAPVNYNDNQLFCGGFGLQYGKYGGKCGVCGDSYGDGDSGRFPRPHEAGGKYGQGRIVKEYKRGETIKVVIELTKNHRGHFEFSICPTNNPLKRATEECLETYKIPIGDGSGYRYLVTTDRNGFYDFQLTLPPNLECSHCVFRWRYQNGNNWGICPDGVGRLGCGNQEEFRGCADVKISGSLGPNPPPRPKPIQGGVIGLRPVVEVHKQGMVKSCGPVILSATEERYKETLNWCQEMCVNDDQHYVCSKLCHCEFH